MSNYNANFRGGHAKGDVRDAFLSALEAFSKWNGRGPAPSVEFEDRRASLLEMTGRLWHCSDILPRSYSDLLDERPSTYARAARIIRKALN
jgi:hypothetical protein